jgi:NADP-reducing hydrogenase subunit HndD
MVELVIDGQAVSVPPGTSILDAAAIVGIEIPALCYDKTLTTFGACRLCSVEIEGRANLAAACSTPVADGMVVHTESDVVVDARRTVLDLLLSDHPQDCLICEKAGDCLLQEYCYRYGVEHTSFVKGATKNSSSTTTTTSFSATRTSASSAASARASAPRSRSPTPSTSPAAASTRR